MVTVSLVATPYATAVKTAPMVIVGEILLIEKCLSAM